MHIRAIDPTRPNCPFQFAWTREQLEDPRRQAILDGLNQQGYNLSVCLNVIAGTKPQITNKLTTVDDIVRQNVLVVRYDECPYSNLEPSFCITAPNAIYGIYALGEAPLSAEERLPTPPSSKRAQIAHKANYGSDGFVPMPGSRLYGSDGAPFDCTVSLIVLDNRPRRQSLVATIVKALRKLAVQLSQIEIDIVALKEAVQKSRTS